ncbi:MAG TPA: type II secretion system F family protein [Rhizomicrobium sp.]|jgi:general secretion pathway protein F
MAQFRFTALTTDGKHVTGAIDAGSEAEAIQQVRGLGHIPITAAPRVEQSWHAALAIILPGRRPSLRVLALMTEELEALLRAGVELDRALRIVLNFDKMKPLAKPLAQVLDRIRDGRSFSDALAATGVFPKLYVSMIRAGEIGGNLAPTLGRIRDYLLRASALRETVISALTYPLMLLIMTGLSIFVILVFVLPQFTPLFQQAGKTLPTSMRIVMTLGAVVSGYWWAALIIVAGSLYIYRRLMEEPRNALARDRVLLRIPLLGDLLSKMQIERFSRTFGTLLANSVPVPVALTITRDTLSNSYIANAVGETAARLKEGENLADRLAQSDVFPPVLLDLVKVGQETGHLEEMMLNLADLFDRETRHTVDRLLALLVPCLTILMGALVAGLIGTILTAILSVNDLAV